jgi:hypothetical protein
MSKKAQWQIEHDAELKTAREKGWMPKTPWKGKFLQRHVGCAILVGYVDAEPRMGIISDVSSPSTIHVLFPQDGEQYHWPEKSQIFGIGERVSLISISSGKASVAFDTGMVACDMK